MPTFEVLEFARDNSLIAQMLDTIEKDLENAELVTGSAPFCKYAFLSPEDVGFKGRATVSFITELNRHQLVSGYTTRKNAGELPYLHRYFRKEKVDASPCRCIAVVLYSKEQLQKEGIEIDADYGIVTAQAEPTWGISPMTPATLLRNALGTEYGGNGEPIDAKAYEESVRFWGKWAIVK